MDPSCGFSPGNVAALLQLLLFGGVVGLYFPQKEYTETVYVGQPAGTPILQVHAMLDSRSERPHFYLCGGRRPVFTLWFQMDVQTGELSLSKMLDETDFASLYQNSWPAKRLSLQVMALNNFSKRAACISRNSAHITLDFVNASIPQCAQTDMKELCFPHRDTSNPHIIENRFPGVLRQLRRLTRLSVCTNYTISYSVESETPAPFAVNGNTSELVVTAPLDREESENYRLLLACTVQTETVITKVETSLDVFVDDEDDNAPYVNGTDTVDVVISFNRTKGAAFGTLFVFDRDLTTLFPKDLSQNRYVGTLLNSEPWIKDTFDIKGTFSERRAAPGGIRESVYDYQLILKRNLGITENLSVYLDYLVNDTTYPGLEGTVLLHFNVTILPVQIYFTNITHVFTLSRKASVYTQVGRICVENCLEFDGFSVTYQLEVPDKNISAEMLSCYSAISITQAPDRMLGLLYVNNSHALSKPGCQDLEYTVVAQEEHTQLMTSTQIRILLHGEANVSQESQQLLSCAENKQRDECESSQGLGATTGTCKWRQGSEKGISENYSTCSPDLRTCPDSVCDAVESKDTSICPQDCTTESVTGGHERGLSGSGIRAGYGTCYCFSEKCFCEIADAEDVVSKNIRHTRRLPLYPGPGCGDSRLSRDTQTSRSPDTSSSSSRWSPRRSQASRET
ncbi:hypothetical protein ILYODFUR_010003 [Ilyodon furcidens]|uniref:Cadherin domain-containing protein n=1 Tax=Ilyodon furcidens TaxID=33524 RepID=A0ABV0SLQ3_9TELE